MMDKSIPYYYIAMVLEEAVDSSEITLPEGFHFVFYHKGDEVAWAEIETAAGEFPSEKAALDYFKTHYGHDHHLKDKVLFIENQAGEKVATGMTLKGHLKDVEMNRLGWMGVKPAFQKLGLGRAIIQKTLSLMAAPIYLTSQSWSYVAIHIYRDLGFKPFPIGEDHQEAWHLIDDLLEAYHVHKRCIDDGSQDR